MWGTTLLMMALLRTRCVNKYHKPVNMERKMNEV